MRNVFQKLFLFSLVSGDQYNIIFSMIQVGRLGSRELICLYLEILAGSSARLAFTDSVRLTALTIF